eukprot:TRINITY_DN1476_c0_g1_i3.p2 TRINITY_DN1476_c0_g1~~TRINITY_DN1476_c0_g1_i3.p2  ORF type:complete len:191 (-),score=-10.26 TRINITY_DN1476_c0_g1_i3:99-671(-)
MQNFAKYDKISENFGFLKIQVQARYYKKLRNLFNQMQKYKSQTSNFHKKYYRMISYKNETKYKATITETVIATTTKIQKDDSNNTQLITILISTIKTKSRSVVIRLTSVLLLVKRNTLVLRLTSSTSIFWQGKRVLQNVTINQQTKQNQQKTLQHNSYIYLVFIGSFNSLLAFLMVTNLLDDPIKIISSS